MNNTEILNKLTSVPDTDLRPQNSEQLARALESLEQTQRQLIQQERLAALGQMASGVAHDFNNILVPILGYTDLLLNQQETLCDPARATPMLRAIHEAAQTARSAIQRLRAFYTTGQHDTPHQPLSVAALVEDAVAVTRPRWQDEPAAKGVHIQLQTNIPTTLQALGNLPELRDALTSLIDNAIDAMQEGGGTIKISATQPQPDQLQLEVSDTGCGMTEEVQSQCLEPFFTTKGGHGTGLGLAMVYGITQRHGGTIRVNSEHNQGTSVTLALIAVPTPQTPPSTTESTAPPAKSTPKRILVADDEAFVRDVLERFLALDGHQTHLAMDGTEAIDAFDKHPFDLVILDRAMPGLSGDQVAAAIRSTSQVPIVMLTGFGDQMIQNNDIPGGVNRVISKPVTIAQLRQAIGDVQP